jgi:hypothetical protein
VFITHGPVAPDSPFFAGRLAELARMEAWLAYAHYVGAVLGARQTGKTSLLLKLRHRLQAKYSFVYVDLEAIHGAGVTECFAYLAEEMVEQLGHPPSPAAAPGDSRNFLAFLRGLAQRGQAVRIVLLLDEVGALPPATAIKLAHTIRSVFTSRHVRPEYRRYVFVLAGATDLLHLTTGVSSPLKNVTDSVYLTDLAQAEADDLLQQGFQLAGADLPLPISARLYHWTRGHPYLTQLLATSLLACPSPLTEATVDRVVEQLLQSEDRNLPYLFKMLASDHAALWPLTRSILAGQEVPFSRSSHLVAELELLGLIRNENGRCRIRNPFYQEAVHRQLIPIDGDGDQVVTLVKLRRILSDYFSEGDLRDLCFDMAIDYEDLPGQNKTDKARELVVYCQRRGRINELIHICRQFRPNAFN